MRGSIEVHRYLTERAISHEFYRLERPLRRLDEAAALLGLKPDRVVAAELFESRRRPILALVPAGTTPSAAALAQAVGERKIRPATPSRVNELTGFMPGWLPPVGHERHAAVVVDAALAGEGALYASGGDPGVMLVIRAEDLARATAGVIADLAGTESESAAIDPARATGSTLLAG